MASIKVKHSGAWKAPKAVKVKQGGSWKSVKSVFLKRGGSWVKVWASFAPNLTLTKAHWTASSDTYDGMYAAQHHGSASPANFHGSEITQFYAKQSSHGSLVRIALKDGSTIPAHLTLKFEYNGAVRTQVIPKGSHLSITKETFYDLDGTASDLYKYLRQGANGSQHKFIIS
ncbi:hypothetical protein [Vibrio breoganii]|uniref:hypothetical protein n=1 Tax=Vibrio breoganii TaxID=553239 RepID=UPI000C817CCC|nr:hypothetical protein [Vibrio breoganii]PMK30660.1 hypothetical protein BCU03_09600 [Vibrio breoganii]